MDLSSKLKMNCALKLQKYNNLRLLLVLKIIFNVWEVMSLQKMYLYSSFNNQQR